VTNYGAKQGVDQGVPNVARGITEKDVFTACDALVLAGERPTIERVRQKIGRGSPNTVSPMLDAWFKGLGRRLQDPGAFAPPPDIPEPLMQAAQHFWEVAQVGARVDLESQVQEQLAPMQAEVERAQHLAAVATAEKESASTSTIEAQQRLTHVTARLEAERAAHAATGARVEAAQRQIDDLTRRLHAAENQAQAAAERARAEIRSAQERAAGAERRAALEIENERGARGKADKRAEILEKRLESLQATSARQLEDLVKAQTALDQERATSAGLRATSAAALAERQAVDAALIEAKVAIGRAEAEAKATQAAMERLLPLVADGRATKPAAKKKSTTSA
jgi:hypothetical protein